MKRVNRANLIMLLLSGGLILSFILLYLAKVLSFSSSSGNIAIAIVSGIIVWFLTHFAAGVLDASGRRKHEEVTEHILDVVKGKWLSLVNANRGKVDSEYYRSLFQNVRRVQISGIACKDLVNDLLDKENKPHPIIEMLKTKDDVNVEIMFADPDSDFVGVRDGVEARNGVRQKPCSTDIHATIKMLKEELASLFKDRGIKDKNTFVVKLTKAPLNCSITHVITNEKETLLWGPLFYHSLGQHSPLYEVPRTQEKPPLEDTLFDIGLKSFESQFRDAKPFLTGSKDGIQING